MNIPRRELPRVAWRRVMREIRTRTAPRTPRRIRVGTSLHDLAASFRERQEPRFFGLLPDQAGLVAQFFPEAYWQTLDEADRIYAHRFDLLGSGERSLGLEIDWHTDFIHGHTWPVEHYTRLKLTDPKGGFDVKVPWELSRFHHGLRLGQAYLYTQDERYAQELVDQITHWIKANPYLFGVNWAGPMDVAIRAVNWLWAYYLIYESNALTDEFLALWLASLRQHGEYIYKNLEDGWPRTNHLIANLAGLAYLGILLPEFPEAERWRTTGLDRLWAELEQQVMPDGVDYEASLPYHGLVTEMALSVAALCLANGIEIPSLAKVRMGLMLDAVMAYTPPNGLVPLIGDADDGRFVPLAAYARVQPRLYDHRYLLALGSLVLEREAPDWAGYVDPRQNRWSLAAESCWQDAFWYFSTDAAARFVDVTVLTTPRPFGVANDDWVVARDGVRVQVRALPLHPIQIAEEVGSRGFEAGGLYVMRQSDRHMVIDAGGVGQAGAGGHAHNDTLSFTLNAGGRPFLVDPGTFAYTGDPAARNAFRSTAAHNVLQLGNEEINPMPEELFRLPQASHVVLHHWIARPEFDLFDASHTGYERLDPPVTHRRQIWFDKGSGLWVLHDAVQLANGGEVPTASSNGHPPETPPQAEIDATLWFHFSTLPVRLDRTNNAIRTELEDGPNLVILPLGEFPLQAMVGTSWISPRYGVREKAPVAKFTGRVKLPADLVLLLYVHRGPANFTTVRAAGRAALVKMRQTLAPALRREERGGSLPGVRV